MTPEQFDEARKRLAFGTPNAIDVQILALDLLEYAANEHTTECRNMTEWRNLPCSCGYDKAERAILAFLESTK